MKISNFTAWCCFRLLYLFAIVLAGCSPFGNSANRFDGKSISDLWLSESDTSPYQFRFLQTNVLDSHQRVGALEGFSQFWYRSDIPQYEAVFVQSLYRYPGIAGAETFFDGDPYLSGESQKGKSWVPDIHGPNKWTLRCKPSERLSEASECVWSAQYSEMVVEIWFIEVAGKLEFADVAKLIKTFDTRFAR